MFLVIVIILLTIGLIALGLGWRGRLVDNRPRCRYCEYDLGGSVKVAAECPECGSVTSGRRAVRHGRREIRWRSFNVGICFLFLTLVLVATWGWGRVNRYNWATAMPSWVLVLQARMDGETSAHRAINELMNRLGAGGLSDSTAAFLVDRALAEQSPLSGDWFGRWDMVFESAWSAGQVTPGHVEAFARNVWVQELRHRTTVRRGQPWTVTEWCGSVRALPVVPVSMVMRLTKLDVAGSGNRLANPFSVAPNMLQQVSQAVSGREVCDWNRISHDVNGLDLEPGTYPVRGTCLGWILDTTRTPPVGISFTIDVASQVTVVESEVPLVRLVRDGESADDIRACIDIESLEVFFDSGTHGLAMMRYSVNGSRFDLAFDVLMQIGEVEYRIGDLTGLKGKRDQGVSRNFDCQVPEFDADHVTITLRPSAVMAEQRFGSDVQSIWGGGEIVIENVPISIVDRRPGRTDQ